MSEWVDFPSSTCRQVRPGLTVIDHPEMPNDPPVIGFPAILDAGLRRLNCDYPHRPRRIVVVMLFVPHDQSDPFCATNAAAEWCCASGYGIGPMQDGAPRGMLRGDIIASKWRNLGAAERNALDGVLIASRGTPAMVVIFENSQPSGKAAA